MAQVVEWKTRNPMVQGSSLTSIILKLCVSGHALALIQNCLLTVRDCDDEVGIAVNLETKGCGFYPHMGQIFLFF